MAASLLAVPFFIGYLGVEGYGLIGFGTAVQSLLVLLDLGLAPTISRQIARASEADQRNRARNLLKSMASIYWGVALCIGVGLTFAAHFIATDWLNIGRLPPNEVTVGLILLGIQLAVRWPGSLYIGALTGGRHLVLSSVLSTGYITLANVGAIAVLAWLPRIEAFFLWQAAIGLLYTLALQRAAWAKLGGSSGAHFDVAELKNIWRFSAQMSGIALISILITQLDKVILSKTTTLTEFAHYMLATLAISSLYRITAPLFNAIYPRFSALVMQEETDKLAKVYRLGSNLFAGFWFSGIMFTVLCAPALLTLWTGDTVLAVQTAPLMSLLALGTGLHGMMFFPYALQLAYGEAQLTLKIHLLLLAIQLPLILILALNMGALGGAIACFVLYLVYMIIGTTLTHRRLLIGLGARWLFFDLGRPLIVSALFGCLGMLILRGLVLGTVAQVAVGLVLASLAALTSTALSPYRIDEIKAVLAD